MVIATASSIAAIGVMLYFLFALTIYALPFYAGISAGLWVYQHGAGLIGALAIGLLSATVIRSVGQILLATLRSPCARAAVAAFYAAPAGMAGFHAVHGLSGLGGASDGWCVTFAYLGAVIVAGMA